MTRFIFISIITVFLSTSGLTPAGAHSGHEKKTETPAQEEPAFKDSIYSAGKEEEPSGLLDEGPGSPFSRTDLLGESEPDPLGLGMDISQPAPMEHMDHEMGGHEQHQEIELASHQWVSSSQKGYGVAIGITLLSGLAFGILSFWKPNE